MTCFIAQNELSAFADDALETARAAELQAHLSGCSACTRELQEIRRVRTMLRAMPVHRAPVDFLAKVMAKAQRKTFLERAGAALEPLLRLPRPAQAGLALAASLVIAVTVFINPATKRGSVWDGAAAPGAAISLSEVANVQATSTPSELSKRQLEGGEKNEEELQLKQKDAGGTQNSLAGQAAPPPPSDQARDEESFADLVTAARKSDADKGRVASTPAPAGTPSFRANGSAVGGAAGNTAYVPPTNPGLYSSTPQSIVASATPRPMVEAKSAPAPSKLGAKVTTESPEADERKEPAYDSSLGYAETAAASDSFSGDDSGDGSTRSAGAGVSTADPRPEARDTKDSSKKELRRDRASATQPSTKAAEASASGRGQAGNDAPAEMESPVVATGAVAAAPEEPVAGLAAKTLSAKYLSAASTAPQDVVAAAKAAGGKLVSPASTPPGLGKMGASTVVIVEIPAAGVAGFEAALRAGGTFERGSLPGGAVRYRIEVVRQ